MPPLPSRMPDEAPIAMPIQRFGGDAPPRGAPDDLATHTPDGILARRLLIALLTGLLAVAAAGSVKESLLSDGLDFWDFALLILFFPLFAWIAFGFITAAIGFVLLITGAHPGFVPAPIYAHRLVERVAVLVPMYNEDVDAVLGRIARMARSVALTGSGDRFDFFVLSDSSADAEPAELAAWGALARHAAVPVYYRRRAQNIGRKPGNVADWIRNHGGAYAYMMVLDADSLMGGEAMVGMAQIMEQRPSVALLQTVPTVIGASTLFQRWMQFASRLYGPISTAGLVWWSGSEATFWGHNALVRISAFAASCGLPELSGGPPFGGAIMSHDMLEACLLRRRGWAVHMIMIDDSHEEFPPSLVDMAVRDRRWAQGNIQHLRLLTSSGFHWINRLQLLIGASAYVTAPAWLALIATTIVQALAGQTNLVDSTTSVEVLLVTVILLFGPKMMSVAWALATRERRAAFGGPGAILRSVALEIPLSMLVAPAIALTQTLDLFSIVRGRPSGWNPQDRDRDGLSIADVMPRYRTHLAVGVVLLLISPMIPMTALWLSPVTAGFLMAPVLAIWTARSRTGRALALRGYFSVPEPPLNPSMT